MKYTYIIPVTGLAAAACSCTSGKKESGRTKATEHRLYHDR